MAFTRDNKDLWETCPCNNNVNSCYLLIIKYQVLLQHLLIHLININRKVKKKRTKLLTPRMV